MKSHSTSRYTDNGASAKPAVNDRALKSLASSIFKQLQEEGCEPRHIISVSSQLIDLVTHELAKDEAPSSL